MARTFVWKGIDQFLAILVDAGPGFGLQERFELHDKYANIAKALNTIQLCNFDSPWEFDASGPPRHVHSKSVFSCNCPSSPTWTTISVITPLLYHTSKCIPGARPTRRYIPGWETAAISSSYHTAPIISFICGHRPSLSTNSLSRRT